MRAPIPKAKERFPNRKQLAKLRHLSVILQDSSSTDTMPLILGFANSFQLRGLYVQVYAGCLSLAIRPSAGLQALGWLLLPTTLIGSRSSLDSTRPRLHCWLCTAG
jgi:hypothetical protein